VAVAVVALLLLPVMLLLLLVVVLVLLLLLLLHLVVGVDLDVRVDDGHHLASSGRQLLLHLLGLGELELVPREVPLAVGVLDVEPQHVVRDVELLKLAVDHAHVGLVVVVPSALVVAEREEGRQRRHAGQLGVPATTLRHVTTAARGAPMRRSAGVHGFTFLI
jgi:hypothetical protein